MSTSYLGHFAWFGGAIFVLMLIAALTWGQPAGIQAERAAATAQATEVVRLRATVDAMPSSTPARYQYYPPGYSKP